jgi:hypothetical protein
MPSCTASSCPIKNGLNLTNNFQHGGLAAKSAYELPNPQKQDPPLTNKANDRFSDTSVQDDQKKFYRGEFTEGEGEDTFAAKGWIRARIVKDGFGIWLFMTHLQADSTLFFSTWNGIYEARQKQIDELKADINKLREEFPSDVFVIMGDFNVL